MSQITVTTKASEKINQFIKDDEDGGQYLRMYVQGGGCSGLSYGMGLEKEPEDDDIVLEEQGVKLLIDSYSINHLEAVSYTHLTLPTKRIV